MKTKFNVARLINHVQASRKSQEYARTRMVEAVRIMSGENYSDETADYRRPMNLLSQYVRIVGRSLIPKNPRILLSTFKREHGPMVDAMQDWINLQIEKIDFAGTIRRAVVAALFSVGIVKVALADPADAATSAWNIRAGEPFVSDIDLDDWVFDHHARKFTTCSFMGHRLRMPRDVAVAMYGKKAKDLAISLDSRYNATGDERISILGRGSFSGDDEWEDYVELWELYLPRHRKIIIIPDQEMGNGGADRVFHEQRWVGPDKGPYHILGYGLVPGNAMPKSPISDLVYLDEATNMVMRKAVQSAEDAKEVTMVKGSADADGERVVKANHGEAIRVDDPASIKQVLFSISAIAPLLTTAENFKQAFSWQAGGLESLGGLGPQAKTATQEQLLAQSASAGIADLQADTRTFVGSVANALMWFHHKHPYATYTSEHTLMPGLSMERAVSPEDRSKLDWNDLAVRVDPYSMADQTPQSKAANLDNTMRNILIPLAGILQQQGVGIDVQEYLKLRAKFMDSPETQQMTTIVEPPQERESGAGASPPAPAPGETTRNYVRESRSERTAGGTNTDELQKMMGQSRGGNPDYS